MGIRHTDKFENSKMKLFAVLAIAVASRQVNQYGDNEVVIGGACTGDGSTECGLTNTECTAEVCACKEGFVEDTDKINCKAEVITDIGADCNAVGAEKCGENAECKAAPTWLRAAGDVCQCKDTFEPSKDDTKNCVTTIVPPKRLAINAQPLLSVVQMHLAKSQQRMPPVPTIPFALALVSLPTLMESTVMWLQLGTPPPSTVSPLHSWH